MFIFFKNLEKNCLKVRAILNILIQWLLNINTVIMRTKVRQQVCFINSKLIIFLLSVYHRRGTYSCRNPFSINAWETVTRQHKARIAPTPTVPVGHRATVGNSKPMLCPTRKGKIMSSPIPRIHLSNFVSKIQKFKE